MFVLISKKALKINQSPASLEDRAGGGPYVISLATSCYLPLVG